MADASSSGGDTKRRRWDDSRLHNGSRGKGNKSKDLGRNEWSRQKYDRRAENEEHNAKRRKVEDAGGDAKGSVLPAPFSKDEIDAEERKPKKKVAVMIGYSGSGYKGMQINTTEKTIEGDLFSAFVASGAISKANANDPKKSALVRCARTDKGVHAAGNVISLKLIVEDPDIVAKINANLSPQIRIWGIQRTVNSFSCYQACDSRWYEYLIPSHCYLPPHPSSFLAKKLAELAEEAGDLKEYQERQDEVATFWADAEASYIKPILDDMEESIKDVVLRALYDSDSDPEVPQEAASKDASDPSFEGTAGLPVFSGEFAGEQALALQSAPVLESINPVGNTDGARSTNTSIALLSSEGGNDPKSTITTTPADDTLVSLPSQDITANNSRADFTNGTDLISTTDFSRKKAIESSTKALRQAYLSAKRAHRISSARLDRISSALKLFLGTQNFHNYTVAKPFRDPSAKRNIKSFTLSPAPLLINGTEWLSLKVHGQSFMMHQIRKMVSMIALTVRCGCPLSRITETFGPSPVSIPKAPGLGLLLERPVFDSYNQGAAAKFEREKIDFGKFEGEMEEFKQREIYERIFREEEAGNAFHTFFNHVDGYREAQFLYLSSKGFEAIKGLAKGKSGGDKVEGGFESEDEIGGGGKFAEEG